MEYPKQRRLTDFIEVKERLWVPPRVRDSLSCCLTTNQGFASDPEDKTGDKEGDEV